MPGPNTKELLIKAANGDHRAFQEIVESQQRFVYSLAFKIVGNAADAEDIVQEAFLHVWSRLSTYKGHAKASTWLYVVVTSMSLNLLKSSHHRRNKLSISSDDAEHFKDTTSTEESYFKKEFASNVDIALNTLPPLQKAVFVLRDLQMVASDETCIILSLTSDQVKAHLYVARKAMAAKLKLIYATDKNKHL